MGCGAVQLRFGKQRAIAGAFAKQVVYLRQGADTSACSPRFAIQPSGSAGKIQDALQVPSMQKAVGEGRMKEVAGSSGVHNANLIRGSIPEALAIPSERAVDAERGADGAGIIFPLELRKSFEEVLFSGGVDGKFLGGDGVVDERKKAEQSGSHMIEVRYDRYSGGAGPGGGQ